MQHSTSDCQVREEVVPQPYDPFGDARYLFKIAESYVPALDEKCRQTGELTRRRRIIHIAGRVQQWIPRKLKEIIQNHWDLGVFDIGFGSIKAFGVYPALYFAGFAWTIPIMEYVPLNTQLWTAGYMYCRRHFLSGIGKLRYGHSLNRMNAHRDDVLKIHPRDARHIHRFECESLQYVVRIRSGRLRSWMRKTLGRQREPNVVHQSELRGMISDKEFIFQANPLRSNAYLYEGVLIAKILSREGDRAKLLKRLVAEEPDAMEVDREFLHAIGEALIPTYARVFEQGDSLTAALKDKLGRSLSATSLGLRWINWAHQRRIYRNLAELDVLRYRLLADILNGTSIRDSEQTALIRSKRDEIDEWIKRSIEFSGQAKAIAGKAEGREITKTGIEQARAVGLNVRLASCAHWLSIRSAIEIN